MQTNTTIKKLGYPLKHPGANKLRFAICIVATALLGLFFYSLVPRTVTLSLTGSTCTNRVQLLPKLISEESENYDFDFRNVVSLNGYPLLAFRTCYALQKILNEGDKTTLTAQFGPVPLISSGVHLMYPEMPSVEPINDFSKPVSSVSPLEFELNSNDSIFRYLLAQSEDNVTECSKYGSLLSCPISSLKLKQGQPYNLELIRVLNDYQYATINEYGVKTANQILLTQQFASTGIVYDSPTLLTLTADRDISSPGEINLRDNDSAIDVPIRVTYLSNKINIELNTPFIRAHNYTLSAKKIIATDGGTLNEDYLLNFLVSSGPKVAGISFGANGLGLKPWLKVTFDQPLNELQDLASQISITSASQNFAVYTEVEGSDLWIQPKANLSACSSFNLTITNRLQNIYGIDGGSEYSTTSRTKCYDQFSIGSSVQGKSITAFSIGSGNKKILFIGAMHGSEPGSTWLLQSWLSDLDANVDKIPSGLQIVIIPTLNPDGFASRTRFNAHNVDLNRNFPTANWQSSTYSSSSTLILNGGGSAPLSEPESSSLAEYIRNNRPALVMTYHSQGSYVIANDAGKSTSLASMYSSMTGYQYFDGSNYDDAFDYAVTGSFEDWMLEELNTATLLVELSSHYGNEYPENSKAMWHILKSL